MTSTDLDDGFDEDEFVGEFGDDEPSEPWHNSTRAVLGASAAGVAVIAVLVAAVMFVSGGDEPEAPQNFIDPSFSATASPTSSPTTTATITSTTPVSTTEINPPLGPPTTSGSSDTSTSGREGLIPPSTRPRQRENDENGGPTSRTRPRLNVTRTLGPGPFG